jgi:hypothetical protein
MEVKPNNLDLTDEAAKYELFVSNPHVFIPFQNKKLEHDADSESTPHHNGTVLGGDNTRNFKTFDN